MVSPLSERRAKKQKQKQNKKQKQEIKGGKRDGKRNPFFFTITSDDLLGKTFLLPPTPTWLTGIIYFRTFVLRVKSISLVYTC